MPTDRIHVFIGTKAQYIKTAPLLRLMDDEGVDYRLIDSGQHAAIARSMRQELGVREPDLCFGGSTDIATISAALRWTATMAARLWSGQRIRSEVFGGRGGVCVVHGDTPSTLIAAVLAWRAGLRVAHLEAGLRSKSILHPFPEELIRILVMRFAHVCFAPTPDAVANLERMKMRGAIVPLSGNTSIEAVAYGLGKASVRDTGPAVVTMHRVENLRSRDRIDGFVRTVEKIADRWPVRFVVHEPTRLALERTDAFERLTRAGVEITPLVSHGAFLEMLSNAPFVVIDGGSIQEECAYLGVPTLLWRGRTEREHGLGANVVLSAFNDTTVDLFLADPERYRTPLSLPAETPSRQILKTLLAELGTPRRS
jgi:UDP-N-acetylglucosamine 2-epimerase